MIKLLYKENASLILEMYVPDGKDGRNALSRMSTDFFFTCPSRRAAMALSQVTNTYLYPPLLLSLPI
jgi:carboxylesterase type B